ncbi:MAG TPA: fused MFS/spermidine synthase, partial [Patescibacteria group bacterium]|nr:fused MFS/spermidine synthase [Patescibacteria group bacterium]
MSNNNDPGGTCPVQGVQKETVSEAGDGASPVLWFQLSLLFGASGCAALMYEIIWFQMLQLVIGSTAVSLAVLLMSFMGGMCLGSMLLPRFFKANLSPLRAWAFLEAGIGLLGLAILVLIPLMGRLYAAHVPSGIAGFLFRGIFSALCLLPPTVLMGASLPVIARLAPAGSSGSSRLGLLYGANTLGGVLGALLAGFVMLRFFDSLTATSVAAGINGIIAAISLTLRTTPNVLPDTPPSQPRHSDDQQTRTPSPGTIFFVLGLSGFCALGAEILWTRLLSLILGGTTYTFSVILAVFLSGLGIGSGVGAILARRLRRPIHALGICQWLAAAGVGWAAFMLTKSLPYWPINPGLSKSVWFNFQLDLLRCAWAVLPATCFWGASFPLALAATSRAKDESGLQVGRLYAANTLGGIIGAVIVSIVLIGWVGTQGAQRCLVVCSCLAGFIALVAADSRIFCKPQRHATALKQVTFYILCVAGALALVWSVPPLNWAVVAYGRYLPERREIGTGLYVGEGMNASVAVSELPSGVRNFHVSGKIEASTDQQDMRLQRMLGHIPALFHPDPRSVLVVGCGAGVTAGSFLAHPGIERIQLCEIEPLIPKVVARYFGEENYDVVQDPRVELIYDDARHFVLTTRRKFDVITYDPIHPWVKGAATLYTREYFEMCKQHLNPGGMVSQWVPLYESDLATVKSEIATFFEVFPEGTIWSNEDFGAGYDLVLLGQVQPLEIEVETLQRRLNRADHNLVVKSLRDVGIRS